MTDSRDDFYQPIRCPKCDGTNLTTSREEEGWVIGCDECDYSWGPFPGRPELFIKV